MGGAFLQDPSGLAVLAQVGLGTSGCLTETASSPFLEHGAASSTCKKQNLPLQTIQAVAVQEKTALLSANNSPISDSDAF